MKSSKKNLYFLFLLLMVATFTGLFLVRASWEVRDEGLRLDPEITQREIAELRGVDAESAAEDNGVSEQVSESFPNEDLADPKEEGGSEDISVVGDEEVVPKPRNLLLQDVPFSSQAPYGKWDLVHEEACEETSLIMVQFFVTGKELTPAEAEAEIQKMKDYQMKTTGQFIDSDMEEVKAIAKGFYDLELEVIYDFELEDIKGQLRRGSPVILPTAGRRLGNPNFTPPGPLYHNLVVIGYDEEKSEFITHDPGTRNGENYRYDQQLLYNAIHDYPGDKTKIETGRKAMVVLKEIS